MQVLLRNLWKEPMESKRFIIVKDPLGIFDSRNSFGFTVTHSEIMVSQNCGDVQHLPIIINIMYQHMIPKKLGLLARQILAFEKFT